MAKNNHGKMTRVEREDRRTRIVGDVQVAVVYHDSQWTAEGGVRLDRGRERDVAGGRELRRGYHEHCVGAVVGNPHVAIRVEYRLLRKDQVGRRDLHVGRQGRELL